MNDYPTKLAEAFAASTIKIFYNRAVAPSITNNDYEGEVRDKTSILNVLTFGAISAHNYDGSNMTVDDLTESNSQLITDQAKYFYFRVKSWDTFRSYIKDPAGTILEQTANELKKLVDIFVLKFYGDVAAGNRIGTDYETGTVEVAVTSGVVSGSGTTFTAGMVGKGFKATGMSNWARVKTFTSTTEIVIEDDSDDLDSAYTGGAIAAGATYAVQSNSAISLTHDNIFEYITDMATTLSNNEVPEDNRFLVVPSKVAALIRLSPEYVAIGSESGRSNVLNGKLAGQFAGFDVYEVSDSRIAGNKTDGYHILGGHRSAICFAMGLTENGTEDLIGNFGKAYKALYVYGAKVPDERRKALVELYGKI